MLTRLLPPAAKPASGSGNPLPATEGYFLQLPVMRVLSSFCSFENARMLLK